MMSNTLSKKIASAHIVGVKDLSGYVEAKPEYIKLTIGEPNFTTDASIKDAAIQALIANDTQYPPALGHDSARKAIQAFERKEHNIDYSLNQIMLTQGSTEALACVLYSLLNEGDEVIAPTPYYPVYRSLVEMIGGVIVPIETKDTGFTMTPERLRSTITDKTKAIIITAPNNPTGTMYTKEHVHVLVDVLKESQCYIIVDEIYARILYTEYYSFAQVDDLKDRVIVIQSFSKIYAMTGWRLGYVLASETLIEFFLRWHHNVITGVTSFIQHAVEPALKLDIKPIVADYKLRRDYVYKRLMDMGFDVVLPDGAFYMFPSIAKYGLDSTTFCKRAALECGVMFVPGLPFGADDHIRISFCYEMSLLEEGMNRLDLFIKSL